MHIQFTSNSANPSTALSLSARHCASSVAPTNVQPKNTPPDPEDFQHSLKNSDLSVATSFSFFRIYFTSSARGASARMLHIIIHYMLGYVYFEHGHVTYPMYCMYILWYDVCTVSIVCKYRGCCLFCIMECQQEWTIWTKSVIDCIHFVSFYWNIGNCGLCLTADILIWKYHFYNHFQIQKHVKYGYIVVVILIG